MKKSIYNWLLLIISLICFITTLVLFITNISFDTSKIDNNYFSNFKNDGLIFPFIIMFIFSIFLLSFLTLVILNKDVFKKKVIYSKLQTYILNILFIGILLSCLIVLFIYSLNAFYIDGPKLEIFYTGIMILPSLLGMIFIISLVSLIYINRRYLFKNDRGE